MYQEITMFLSKIFDDIPVIYSIYVKFRTANRHQKKALVIELYNQGKTRRQIAEIVHMSFKDIADIINEYSGEDKQINKPEKSKDSRAFELFLQGKQSVEVAIELDMPAEKVEELHVSILGTLKFETTWKYYIMKQNILPLFLPTP